MSSSSVASTLIALYVRDAPARYGHATVRRTLQLMNVVPIDDDNDGEQDPICPSDDGC